MAATAENLPALPSQPPVADAPAIAAFSNESNFVAAQRIARGLASSTLVPQSYRGQTGLPNVLIALELANRIGASPLAVMQNLHVIQGRPSWSASFLIATVNASGKFSPVRFETAGGDEPKAKGYKVRAYAEDRATKERCVGPWVDWPTVEAEGWLSKSGSKWKTMPALMFMYRAAAFWTRVYAPELSLGIHTTDELQDVYGGMPEVRLGATTAVDEAGIDAALIGSDMPADVPADGADEGGTA